MKNLNNVVGVIAAVIAILALVFSFNYTQDLKEKQEMVEVRVGNSSCFGKGKIYCFDQNKQWFTTTRVFGKVQLSETKDLKEGEIPPLYRILQGLRDANISYK